MDVAGCHLWWFCPSLRQCYHWSWTPFTARIQSLQSHVKWHARKVWHYKATSHHPKTAVTAIERSMHQILNGILPPATTIANTIGVFTNDACIVQDLMITGIFVFFHPSCTLVQDAIDEPHSFLQPENAKSTHFINNWSVPQALTYNKHTINIQLTQKKLQKTSRWLNEALQWLVA